MTALHPTDLYDAEWIRVRPHDTPDLGNGVLWHPGCERGRILYFYRWRGDCWVVYVPEGKREGEMEGALVSACEVLE